MKKRKTLRRAGLRLMIALLAAGSVAAHALPDLKRAQARLEEGRRAEAEREFHELAEFGLPSAQIALGDMLRAGPPGQRNTREAIRWYYLAGQRDSRGYSRIAQLFATDYTVDPAEIDIIVDKLVRRYNRGERSLAGDIGNLLLARGGGHNLGEVRYWAELAREWGDVRGSLQLGMTCDAPLARKVDADCALKHYREAAPHLPEATGRLIALLQRQPGLGSSRKEAEKARDTFLPAERFSIYRTYLKAVGGLPQMSVAETLLNGIFDESTAPVRNVALQERLSVDQAQLEMEDFSVFDPTDAALELLAAYAKNTGPEAQQKFLDLLPYAKRVRPLAAALMEADVYIAGTLLPAQPEKAEAALLPWAERSPQAALTLGDIYRIGYLDEPDYAAARRYYEIAGRGGMGLAWYSLTRMYLGSPALIPDFTLAQEYASAARKAGYVQVDYLLETIPVMQGAR